MTTRLPNPFEHHDLAGWRSAAPGVRFPPSFSVEQAGDVHMLFVSPVSAPMLHAALDLPAGDPAALLDERGGAQARPWGDAVPDADIELVHLGPGPGLAAGDLPSPLIADPAALPAGCLAALSVQDGCHGVVLSRDPDRLTRCLRRFLDAYVEAAAGTCSDVPALPTSALSGLLDGAPEGASCRPALHVRPRFWVMDLDWHGADGAALGTERWVSEGARGRWRAGWDW